MKLKIAIIDDLESDRKNLLTDITGWFNMHDPNIRADFFSFQSGISFLQDISFPESFDLVFLDICMAEKNGLETAKELRAMNPDCMIIFVTTEKDYALNAYSVHPFDFLVKPVSEDQLNRVLGDVSAVLKKESEEIPVRVAYGEMTLPVSSIISVIASGHTTEYHLKDSRILNSPSSFSEASRSLASFGCFLEINRGVMINMELVRRICPDHIVMNDGKTYPVRVRGRSELLRRLTQYQIKHRMEGV